MPVSSCARGELRGRFRNQLRVPGKTRNTANLRRGQGPRPGRKSGVRGGSGAHPFRLSPGQSFRGLALHQTHERHRVKRQGVHRSGSSASSPTALASAFIRSMESCLLSGQPRARTSNGRSVGGENSSRLIRCSLTSRIQVICGRSGFCDPSSPRPARTSGSKRETEANIGACAGRVEDSAEPTVLRAAFPKAVPMDGFEDAGATRHTDLWRAHHAETGCWRDVHSRELPPWFRERSAPLDGYRCRHEDLETGVQAGNLANGGCVAPERLETESPVTGHSGGPRPSTVVARPDSRGQCMNPGLNDSILPVTTQAAFNLAFHQPQGSES